MSSGHALLVTALQSRGFVRDPRSREAYKLRPETGPQFRVDFGKKAARLEERYGSDWRGVSQTLYYGQIKEDFAAAWAAWALAKASGFTAGREPALVRTASAQKSVDKSRQKAAAEREQTNGPGFYVTNSSTYQAKRPAQNPEPFKSLGPAVEFAWKKYEEYISLGFHYLHPVEVVEARSRDAAEHGQGHVVWTDGKLKGQPVDPRQMTLPGVRRVVAIRRVHLGEVLPPRTLVKGNKALVETDAGWAVVKFSRGGTINQILLDEASYKAAKNVFAAEV